MKLIVRAFVVVLALTGAVASAKTSSAPTAKTIASSTFQGTGITMVPRCPPDGKTDCGLGQSGN